jgi:hypothetical protein
LSYIGKTPVIGNFVKLDAISVVNGQAAYTMQNGGANFTEYSNVNQFLVSLNGILQSPTDSFSVSSSTITFASNLVTGDVIDFIIVLGNSLDVGVPSDNTVSLAKLTATGTKDATTFLRGDNTFDTPSVASLSTASGSAPSYSARAWVNFNGTGTIAIRGSGNVSSLTDNGTGNYTVNFTTAIEDTNYAVGMSATRNDDSGTDGFYKAYGYNTANISVGTENNGSTPADFVIITLAVFR